MTANEHAALSPFPDQPAPRFADVGGGRRIAYDEVSPEHPNGTVLLLSGLNSKRFGWAGQLPVFGRAYRAIAMDNRDYGDSDPYEDPYAITDLADDAAALLRALNAEPAHVVGISMGGMIAQHVALRHPDVVASLVLVATTAGGPTHVPPTPEAQALLTPTPGVEIGERAKRTYRVICAPGYLDANPHEAERVAWAARYRPATAQSYARQLNAAVTHDTTALLQNIHVPTLVIHGALDPLVRVENGRHLAGGIHGAHYVEYPDTGHMPTMERAETFNADVLNFIASANNATKKEHQ